MKSNIPNFSHYYIAKDGQLYSDWKGNWRVVKPAKKSNGYMSNSLVSDSGKRYNRYRHRLVAEAYLPNPLQLPQVCHKNNNPSDNRLSNLYWGTAFDNMGQCVKDGRFYFIGKTRERKVDTKSLIQDYQRGVPRKDILNKYSISTGLLYKIIKGAKIELRKKWKA